MAQGKKLSQEETKAISVKLPFDLLERAREKSEETGISLSFVVRKAIEEWVKKED